VVEVSAFVISVEGITELGAKRNRTLSYVGHAVHKLRFELSHSMPMHGSRCSLCLISKVNHDDVIFADMDRWAWQLEIYAQKSSLCAIS
jgi:hypothetical protein